MRSFQIATSPAKSFQRLSSSNLLHKKHATLLPCLREQHSTTPSPPQVWYRLLYFDTRGAAEPIRYFLAIHNVPYQDVRYPLQASAKGFGVDDTYLTHQVAGTFKANMNRVPILQIVQQRIEDGDASTKETILAEIGQTHAILRFLDQQHNSASKRDPLHRATIDAFVENVRDVRSAWYKAKSTGSKHEFLIHDLSEWCRKLEDSLPLKETIETPWLIGDYLSLADIALYAMLAAPVSLMTGSSQSFFDGASSELIQDAYNDCHRLQQSMAAMAKLPVVRQWEDRRPDTFN